MNIKIGRDLDSDILLSDAKASRNHALLTISRFGKMTLTDLSANGTWVNGTRLEPDVAYIVTRRDYVSFADDAEYLDWSVVPNRRRKVVLWSSLSAVLFLLVALCLGIYYFSYEEPVPTPVPDEYYPAPDSLIEDKAVEDSDSIAAPEAEDAAETDEAAPDEKGAAPAAAPAAPAAKSAPAAPAAAPAKSTAPRRKAKSAAKPSKSAPAAPKSTAQPSAAQPAPAPSAPAAPQEAPAKKPRIFM